MALGIHLSTASGLKACLERADHLGLQALQIYTRSTTRWFTPPIEPDEVVGFRQRSSRFDRHNLLALASPLINLASADQAVYRRSLDALYDELMRAEALGFAWVVLQPGNHGGQGEEAGIRRVIQGLNKSLERTRHFRCGILLETSSGDAHDLGSGFEQLARLRKRAEDSRRIGICVDTARIFIAGYDLRDLVMYRTTTDELARTVGLRHVHALHLNDARFPLGSRREGSVPMGEGEIGRDGFACFLNDSRFTHLPMILESPGASDPAAEQQALDTAQSPHGTMRVDSPEV